MAWQNAWRDPKRPSTPEFAEFAEALTRARACAERREVELIVKHAETDWRAAAWMLERRNPARYGRNPTQHVDLTVREGAPVQHRNGLSLSDLFKTAVELGIDPITGTQNESRVDELRERYGVE